MKKTITHSRRPALYIAVIYFLVGLCWIYFSDRLEQFLPITFNDHILFQTLKGWLYIITTAILLYALIVGQIRKRNQLIELLTSDNHILNKILGKNAGFSILLTDKHGKVVLAKGELLTIGEGASTNSKKHDLNHLEQLNSESVNTFLSHLWRNKQATLHEFQLSEKWYEISGHIISSEIYQSELALLIFKDESNVKKREHKIIECQELISIKEKEAAKWKYYYDSTLGKLELLTENLYDGIIVTSVNIFGQAGRIIKVNKEACNIINSNEVVQLEDLKEYLLFKSPKEEELIFKNNFLLNQQVVVTPFIKNGKSNYKTVEIIGRYIKTERHPYVLFILRRVEVFLHKMEEDQEFNYKTLLDTIDFGIMLYLPDRNCFYLNHYVEKILRLSIPNKDGLSMDELETFGQDVNFEKHWESCIKGMKAHLPPYKLTKQEGKWFDSTLIPIMGSQGSLVCIMRVITDITPMMEFSNEIKALKNNLNESSMLKQVFLSNLSHEIRTPMNGISGFLSLLEFEDLTQTQRQYLDLIQQSSETLFNMLESIIELSQLENKSISTNKSWFKFSDLVKEIELAGRYEMSKHPNSKVAIRFNTPEYFVHEQVYSDQEKIISISKQLINNAVKFTPQGTIDVKLLITPDDYFELTVKDTGVGIKGHNLNTIFLPFATFNTESSMLFGGLGLGLPIVQRYTQLLGGNISVKSSEGKGSDFKVIIPLTFGDVSKPQPDKVYLFRKVLIIQYNVETSNDNYSQFHQFDMEVIYSTNGTEALEIVLEHPDIDLIITDINLTDMSSFELLLALRKMHLIVPVIVQTTFFVREEKDKFIKAGFEDYLSKPIYASQLFQLSDSQ